MQSAHSLGRLVQSVRSLVRDESNATPTMNTLMTDSDYVGSGFSLDYQELTDKNNPGLVGMVLGVHGFAEPLNYILI